MRNKIYIIVIALIFLAIAPIGCAKKPSKGDKIVARVSNKFITLKEFNSKIDKMPSYYRNIIEKNKKKYLDEMIIEMLFYEDAVRKGVDRDREVKEVVREAKKKIVIAKFLKNEVEDNIKVTDDESREFYEAHKEEFKAPPLWRASHILVATEKEAQDTKDALAKGESFEELAKARSMDATASRGGDIGYFRVGQLVPDFEQVCLKLNVGEVSPIVHTQFGYHVIKLTDKKEPQVEEYEKVKRAIESELKKGKRKDLFDKLVTSLREKYGVEINEGVFEDVK